MVEFFEEPEEQDNNGIEPNEILEAEQKGITSQDYDCDSPRTVSSVRWFFLILLPILSSFLYLKFIIKDEKMISIDKDLPHIWKIQKDNCFNLFILIGDATSHEAGIRTFIDSSRKIHVANEVNLFSFFDLKSPSGSVIFVKDSEKLLKTSTLSSIYQKGNEKCKREPTIPFSIFLSTSLGSDLLNDVDDVGTNKYLQKIREDAGSLSWLQTPQISMNRHLVIHGMKGKRPYQVFNDFFLNFNQEDNLDFFKKQNRTCAVSSLARKVILKHDENWLLEEYYKWTLNNTCDVVIYAIDFKTIGSFPVSCESKPEKNTMMLKLKVLINNLASKV